MSTTNLTMCDKVLSYIKENEPVKTSAIVRDLDIQSKYVREICETTEEIQGVKVRQCYYWTTAEQLSALQNEIRDFIKSYSDRPCHLTDALDKFATTKPMKDYIRSVIFMMCPEAEE